MRDHVKKKKILDLYFWDQKLSWIMDQYTQENAISSSKTESD